MVFHDKMRYEDITHLIKVDDLIKGNAGREFLTGLLRN